MFQIEEELKKLPGQPGVYIMHDAKASASSPEPSFMLEKPSV